MSERSQARPSADAEGAPAARKGSACRREQGHPDTVECPSCGSPMRLWANYHRCRNCGYKESCCF
ncbi:hypothetical protein K2Z83_18225 [Oscillochloris sp. ZM17-4]|uniref:hypothetical protein n=1 Tax=Oscillochloris sp. ZM17-4 TaxID=2866714 RepID=UPI001C72C01E|nr:hypothetical protein [Oscillochloris sp. ZM17-4]MBX0329610.1 hypothetical protein [Oscillochloris sp. ZM17-4]